MNARVIVTTVGMTTLLSVSAFAEDVMKPGFTNLTQAVGFLTECARRDDLTRFTNACVRAINSAQMHSNVLAGLKQIDARKPLKEIYSGKAFPTNSSSFMMGGHAKELGFINIPFEKTNDLWYVSDYCICR